MLLTGWYWNNNTVNLNRFSRYNWNSRRKNSLKCCSSKSCNFVDEKFILVVWIELLCIPAYQNLKSMCHEYSTWINVAILQIITIFVCNVLSKSLTNTFGIFKTLLSINARCEMAYPILLYKKFIYIRKLLFLSIISLFQISFSRKNLTMIIISTS
jgi:hypothetical protein